MVTEKLATCGFLHSTSRIGITDHDAKRFDDIPCPLPYLLTSVTPIFFDFRAFVGIRVQAAVEDSSWLMVDAWECSQSDWTRSALVLRELGKRLPQVGGRKVKVMMVSAHVDPACWC